MTPLRDQIVALLSAAAERMSNARCAVARAVVAARQTSGVSWRDESVRQARDEFIRAGAAHAAARQLLRDLDAAGRSS